MPIYSLSQRAGEDNPTFTPDPHANGKVNVKAADKNVDPEMEKRDSDDEKKDDEDDDPWKETEKNYTKWEDLTSRGKVVRVVSYPLRIVLVLLFLYLFICSLDFLSSAFKLLGGKKAGEVFQQSDILTNPIAGLMIGVLVTVLVQSSSTSTSIVISMVGAKILSVKTAVPIVMGANIGTSVTNTIVAIGQITNPHTFRRAFAGATVHDMFNWITVLILLPLEIATGYLFHLSNAILNSLHLNATMDYNQELLTTITKPFTSLIIQVSSSGITDIAQKKKNASDVTMIKLCCDDVKPESCCNKQLPKLSVYGGIKKFSTVERTEVCKAVDHCVVKDYAVDTKNLDQCITLPWAKENVTATVKSLNTLNCQALGGVSTQQDCCMRMLKKADFFTARVSANASQQRTLCASINSTCYAGSDAYDACTKAWTSGRAMVGEGEVFDCGVWATTVERTCNKPCEFLFRNSHQKAGGPLSDEATGGILLIVSLIVLCVCLVCIVKLLNSLLQGSISKVIKKFVNADFPGYCAYFTGYVAILIGAGLTVIVQSSSIFTSTLTPLVGIGVIELDRMYPLTLGSNIGTTATGILAALAQKGEDLGPSLQVAFCHLFFNVTGILILYPLPFFRPPIPAANFLGRVTAQHRWFSLTYLAVMFFLLPLAIFGLSIPGWYVLAAVLIPAVLIVLFVVIIKCLQAKRPSLLPTKLRTWDFLPLPLRSLQPYDACMRKVCFCSRFHDVKPNKRVKKAVEMTVQVNETAEDHGDVSTNRQPGYGRRGVSNEGFDGVIITSL